MFGLHGLAAFDMHNVVSLIARKQIELIMIVRWPKTGGDLEDICD